MRPVELARHLRVIHETADRYRPDRAEVITGVGDAYVTLDPESDSPYPSANLNSVQFMGCTAGVAASDIDHAVALFAEAGCQRFFFWLSPCAQVEEIQGWLLERGLTPFGGTGYPTLLRPAEAVPSHVTPLEIRRLSSTEAENQSQAISTILGETWAGFVMSTCGQAPFDHYAAYAGGRLVSTGGLYRHGDVGYLGWTATAETHRGQGGQSALITARINRAVEKGCRWVCSETLYMLESSLRNLKRKGFEIAYEKKVLVWEREPQPVAGSQQG